MTWLRVHCLVSVWLFIESVFYWCFGIGLTNLNSPHHRAQISAMMLFLQEMKLDFHLGVLELPGLCSLLGSVAQCAHAVLKPLWLHHPKWQGPGQGKGPEEPRNGTPQTLGLRGWQAHSFGDWDRKGDLDAGAGSGEIRVVGMDLCITFLLFSLSLPFSHPATD